jgi:hypothetical protein
VGIPTLKKKNWKSFGFGERGVKNDIVANQIRPSSKWIRRGKNREVV